MLFWRSASYACEVGHTPDIHDRASCPASAEVDHRHARCRGSPSSHWLERGRCCRSCTTWWRVGYVDRGRRPGDRRRAQPVARRGPRRRQLLPRLPHRPPADARASSSAAPRPARPWAAQTLFDAARERTRPAGYGDVELEEVFCLGNCALGPSGQRRRRAARPARRATGSTDARPQGWRHEPDDRPSTSPATPRPSSVGADEVAAAFARDRRRHASSATARAACCGSSRWSRSRPTEGRVGYGPVAPGRRPRCSTAGLPTAPDRCLGRRRRAPLAGRASTG